MKSQVDVISISQVAETSIQPKAMTARPALSLLERPAPVGSKTTMTSSKFVEIILVVCVLFETSHGCGSKKASISWENKVFEAVHSGNVTKVRGVIGGVVALVGLENLERIVNIAKEGDWRWRQECPWTLLHEAVRYSHPDVVQFLLESGAEVDFPCPQNDGGKETPLFLAVREAKDRMEEEEAAKAVMAVWLLLEGRADPNTVGYTIYIIVASALDNNLSDRRFCQQFKIVAVSDKDWPTLKKVRSIEQI